MVLDFSCGLDLVAIAFTLAYLAKLLFISEPENPISSFLSFDGEKRSLLNQQVRRRAA